MHIQDNINPITGYIDNTPIGKIRYTLHPESKPAFDQWCMEFRIRNWADRTPVMNAREAMREWDSSRLNTDKIVVEQ